MRIGIDCLPLQTQTGRLRGIGRYSRDLVKALLAADESSDYLLYLEDRLSTAHVPTAPNAQQRFFSGPRDRPLAECPITTALEGNPDRLDAFLTLSPHEQPLEGRYGIPLLVSVVYDLVPDRDPATYQVIPGFWERYERYLAALHSYDRLLAISQATAADFVALRGFDPERITVISSGFDREAFHPGPGLEPARARMVGITRSYVLHVGGMDPRKGGDELLAAFAELPATQRSALQLVYAYDQSIHHAFVLRQRACKHYRLNQAFVATGYVDEATLVRLYQGALLMALPSKGEGFGLPLLESMACGVPVVAGNNTSQPEVVGDGGVCVDAASPASIARGLHTVLANRRQYADAALRRAATFSWAATARKTLETLLK